MISQQVGVNLIGDTSTRNGLRIKAGVDENAYAKRIKVFDKDIAALIIERDAFHGEWSYQLPPRTFAVNMNIFKLTLLKETLNKSVHRL